LSGRYRQLDYKINLKNKNKLTSIENDLKLLNENINPKDQLKYLSELTCQISIVHDIYHENKKKIDETIKEFEDAMLKYKHYDFDTRLTPFYLEFKAHLNLLLYIRETSTSYTHIPYNEFDDKILSEILFKISSIMIVNHGILKLSKY